MKLFSVILSVAIAFNLSSAVATLKTQKSAYPQTMMTDAKVMLDNALDKQDDNKIIKSLIDYFDALYSISDSGLPQSIELIDSVISTTDNPVTKSMLYSIEAQAFSSNMSRNRFNNKINIDRPTPLDITEWSSMDYSKKIMNLITLSLKNAEILKNTPITKYKDCISFNKKGIIFCPTVFDFISYNAINCINNIISDTPQDNTSSQKAKNQAETIFANLLDFHKNNYAPYIYSLIHQMEYQSGINNFKQENLKTQYAQLYDKYFLITPFSGLFLAEENNYRYSDNIAERSNQILNDWNFQLKLQQFVKRYPKYMFVNDIKRIIAELERGSISLNINSTISSTDSIRIKCVVKNVNKYTISIIPQNGTILPKSVLHKPIKITTRHKLPFMDTTVVVFPPLPYGEYSLIADFPKKVSAKREFPIKFRVTNIMTNILCTQNGENKAIATDNMTGAPIPGVEIMINNRVDNTSKLGAYTDQSGIAVLNNISRGEIQSVMGKDKYSTPVYFYGNMREKNRRQVMNCEIFTDLAVYRPGDTIKFVGISYYFNEDRRITVNDTDFQVYLRNPNYEITDSIKLRSDAFGRFTSSFVVPKTGLNGNYSINVTLDNINDRISSKYIEVSEYKAPSFMLEFVDMKPHYTTIGGDLNIRGVAKTYSGVPLTDCDVTILLKKSSYFRFMMPHDSNILLQEFKSTTNSKGELNFTIPASLFNQSSEIPFSIYTLVASATNMAGETQSSEDIFTVGKNYTVIFQNSNGIDISNPIKLPVIINSSIDDNKLVKYSYLLKGINTTDSLKGDFIPQVSKIDISSLKSGEYKLSVKITDGDYTSDSSDNIILFRPSDSTCPIKSAMWIPNDTVRCNNDSVVTFTIGNSTPKSYIYYIAYSSNDIVASGWLEYAAGMRNFSIKIPQPFTGQMNVMLMTTSKYETYSKIVKVLPSSPDKKIILSSSSFRDKIMANSTERWTFTLKDNYGNPIKGAFLAEMYNSALNTFAPNRWNWSPEIYYPYYCNLFKSSSYLANAYFQTSIKKYKSTYVEFPSFEEIEFPDNHVRNRMRLNNMMKSEDNADYLHEVIVMEKASVGATKSATNMATMPKIDIRTRNIQSGLWKPLLQTNANGEITLTTPIPNENTTWYFQALAYSDDLLTSILSKEIISQKPIMVAPNLPRFLRQGDNTVLSASILNATDSIKECNVIIELFNPIDNKVIKTKSSKISIAPNSQDTCIIDWNVPDNISLIGYRIKGATSQYGDGEQSVIPVLQASTYITESKPFYLTQGEKNYTIDIPKASTESRITFEYCDNPIWYCVTALPSISSSGNMTANETANSLFAICIAKGIAESYPMIQNALSHWAEMPSDSTLVSMLQRNESLKIGQLSQSPWLNSAQKQTLRMKQFKDIFNKYEMPNRILNLVNRLTELQNIDGGIGWTSSSISSPYITNTVLVLLGEINKLGFLPEIPQLTSLISGAMKYMDKATISSFENMKKYDNVTYEAFLPYIYARSLFPKIPYSSDLSGLKSNAIKAFANNWKNMNLPDKAYVAIVMQNDNKTSVAKDIMESIRQYGIYKPNTGMWWENKNNGIYSYYYNPVALTTLFLNAFHAIEPQCKEIDMIRQWILLQKETTDWGNSSMASAAVYSLLNSGTKWNLTPQLPKITINSKALPIDSIAKYTGYIQTQIKSSKNNRNSVEISRSTNAPAWGSIFTQYSEQIKDIKNVSIEGLSISKDFISASGDKYIENKTPKVGDKIKVYLTIKTDRDLEYVMIKDDRCAAMEPVDQLSEYKYQDRLSFYQETKDSETNLFITNLPKGTHTISYDVYIMAPGSYSLGIATIQSQYAPALTAHSEGTIINIK